MTLNNEDLLRAAEQTPAMWQQVLQQHAALQHQGRTFIVLTAQGNLAAHHQIPAGGQEVKFKTVAAIISEFIKRQDIDPTLKQNFNHQLVSLALHTVIHYPSNSVLRSKKSFDAAWQILESYQASQSSVSTSSSSTTATNELIIIPNRVYQEIRATAASENRAASATQVSSDLSRIVSDPEMEVNRSRTGRDGAYFLTVNHLKVLVKFVKQPLRHILADRLFQALKFKTPNTRLVPANEVSSEKKMLILNKGSPSALDNKSKALRPLVLMDYLDTPTWENTFMNDRKSALKYPLFAKQIGKMLVLDVIIGNNDRIARGNYNSGNFMINIDEDKDPISYDLVLCDNEIRLDDEVTRLSRRHELRQLLSERNVILEYLFASRFVQPDMLKTKESEDVIENVAEGMKEGAREFLQLCKDPEKLSKIFDTTGLPAGIIDFDYLKALISVKESLENLMEKQS